MDRALPCPSRYKPKIELGFSKAEDSPVGLGKADDGGNKKMAPSPVIPET